MYCVIKFSTHNFAVFGWFQDTFIGMEQAASHSVQAGYLKGASHTNNRLEFNVVSKVGTAGKLVC